MAIAVQPSDLTDDSRRIPLWAPVAAVSGLLVAVAYGLPGDAHLMRVGGLLAAAAPWAIVVVAWRRGRHRGPVALALALVVATRFVLAFAPPALSPDVYRYAFEGESQRLGAATPYLVPPAAPRLAPLRPPWFDRITYPKLTSIYFPAAELLLRGAARGPDPVRAVKVALAALDGLTVLLLALWLRRTGRDPAGALVYGACPLVLAESSLAGHLDVAVALAVIAALYLLEVPRRPRPLVAGAALAAAALVKPPLAVVLALVLARRAPAEVRGFRLRLASGAGLAGLLLWLPYRAAGTHLFDALFRYAAHWRACDGAFAVVLALWRGVWAVTGLDHAGPGGTRLYAHLHLVHGGLLFSGRATHVLLRWGRALPAHPGFPAPGTVLVHLGLWPGTLARGTVGLLGLGIVVAGIVAARRRPSAWPLPRLVLVTLATLLFLAPTAFPWYWLPVLALLPLSFSTPVAVLAGCLPAYYLVALPAVGTVGGEPWWLRLLVYGPAVAAVALGLRTARRKPGPAPAPAL